MAMRTERCAVRAFRRGAVAGGIVLGALLALFRLYQSRLLAGAYTYAQADAMVYWADRIAGAALRVLSLALTALAAWCLVRRDAVFGAIAIVLAAALFLSPNVTQCAGESTYGAATLCAVSEDLDRITIDHGDELGVRTLRCTVSEGALLREHIGRELIFLYQASHPGYQTLPLADGTYGNLLCVEIPDPKAAQTGAEEAELEPELSAAEQLAAVEQHARESAAEQLALSEDEFGYIWLWGWFFSGEAWPIQRTDNREMLVAMVTDSALYRCPDEYFELREAARSTDDCVAVLFAAPGVQSYLNGEVPRCRIVCDSLGMYVACDGAYYITDIDRADEITAKLEELVAEMRVYLQNLVFELSTEEERLDPNFINPVNEWLTADDY